MGEVRAIRMPKWGLAMEEGTIVTWLKKPGERITEGDEIVEIETTKITNVLEATSSGTLARIVGDSGNVLPVGSLIAVLTEGDVSHEDIDDFIASQPAVLEDDEIATEQQAVRLVDVDGQKINVATAGSGAPIVLLHGFSGDFNNWMLVMDRLKSRNQVIALDLPGHGASTKEVGDGSLAQLARTVAGLLGELGVESSFVVGHSLGGAIAMQLALDHPRKVGRVGLICPMGLPGTEVSGEFLDMMIRAERSKDFKAALQLLFAEPGAVSRDMVEGVSRNIRLDGARSAMTLLSQRMRSGIDIDPLRARLAELSTVTLVATDNDQITGKPNVAQLPPEWDVHWIEGAAHMPHLVAADRVANILSAAVAD